VRSCHDIHIAVSIIEYLQIGFKPQILFCQAFF
jgi:hypothetical protein